MTASGRNGFEVYLLLLIAAWASVSWLGGQEGETILAIFTSVGRHIWFGLLLGSSLLALVGIFLGNYIGLQIERAGLAALAGAFVWVGMAFIGLSTRVDTLHLLYVAPMLLIAAAVAVSRVQQIRRDLDRMRITLLTYATLGQVT
jgi:hypothetical protein